MLTCPKNLTKGKNMKKIISFLLLISTLLCLISLGASAAVPESSSIAEDVQDNDALSSSDTSVLQDDEALPENEDGTSPSELYDIVMEHIGEVFAFLACTFSALLMLCYKKGILPMIKGGINALSGGVSALSDEARKQSESSAVIGSVISERLAYAEEILGKMESSLELIEKRLGDAEMQKNEGELMRSVLLEEVNMLYEVFMAATMPEYQKDRVTKQVEAMRERLSSFSGGDNEEA